MHSVVLTRSYGSVKVFWLDRGEALRRLKEAAGNLIAARPDVTAVYVFGSLPQGRAVPGSDADVLIVLRQTSQRWLDRPLEFHPYFDGVGIPVEIFCYTAAEVVQNPLARGALARGVMLAQAQAPGPSSAPPPKSGSSEEGGAGGLPGATGIRPAGGATGRAPSPQSDLPQDL